MKGFIKKHGKEITVLIGVGIFIVPLAINLLFKIPAPISILKAEWTAGDAILFYGAILGASIAVWGVFLSIKYAQESYRDDVRNRVLPYFTINLLDVRSKQTGLSLLLPQAYDHPKDERTDYYEEISHDEFYFTVKDGNVDVRADWTEEQKAVIQNLGKKSVPRGSNSWSVVVVDYLNLPIKVKNIGLGTAVLFQVGLNPKSDDKCFTKMLSIMPQQEISLHIYIDGFGETNIGEYELVLLCRDIYETQYNQTYPFSIKEIEKDGQKRVGFEIDQSGSQKQLKEVKPQ